MDNQTLKEGCQEYIDLLNSPANGHGQHVHPTKGISHNLLSILWSKFGQDSVTECLDTLWDNS